MALECQTVCVRHHRRRERVQLPMTTPPKHADRSLPAAAHGGSPLRLGLVAPRRGPFPHAFARTGSPVAAPGLARQTAESTLGLAA